MRTIIFAVAAMLSIHSYAQSLKSSSHFLVPAISNTADAPAIITITDSLYDNLHLEEAGLERDIFFQAYKGFLYLLGKNKLHNTDILTIADYSQSSNNKRLYVIDLSTMQLVFQTYVSHGKNSGGEFASSFSNEKDSNKSSVGFLVTGEVYVGNYGTSLRLDGTEAGINDHVRERDIVFHGSNFVNDKIIEQKGKIGRSLGCPAVPKAEHLAIIESIKNGSCFFIYHQNKTYAKRSKIINAKCNWPAVATASLDATASNQHNSTRPRKRTRRALTKS
jgi:hypothetical protein